MRATARRLRAGSIGVAALLVAGRMRGYHRTRFLVRSAALAAAILFAAACGRSNPVLGNWEIDRDETSRGALLAAEATELTTLRFESTSIASPGTEIPVSYVVEGDLVRAVRGDGRGEHRVEVLPDGRIRVELPIGVTAVYQRAGS